MSIHLRFVSLDVLLCTLEIGKWLQADTTFILKLEHRHYITT